MHSLIKSEGQIDMTRPLDGITVVSLEHAIATPLCTRQLADMIFGYVAEAHPRFAPLVLNTGETLCV
jgi:hypothetical protein